MSENNPRDRDGSNSINARDWTTWYFGIQQWLCVFDEWETQQEVDESASYETTRVQVFSSSPIIRHLL